MGNITENCKGCTKVDNDENCMVYANPTVQMRWVDGSSKIGCTFNRKNLIKEEGPQTKVRVGQQKQKKR